MERPHGLWIAVAAFLVISSLISHTARAQLPDVCTSAGGTAECTGPEVGNYQYIGGTTSWPGSPAYVWYASEAPSLQALLNFGTQVYRACTQNLENPAWLPMPAGPLGHGGRNVGDIAVVQQTTGDYWAQSWTLGAETQQIKYTVRIKGTAATDSVPACSNTLYSGSLGMTRLRGVHCPVGWMENFYTAPTLSYCWRAPQTKPDPPKNFGPCADCDMSVGDSMNASTGNKYNQEPDYRGSGPFPLEYVRRHNSQAYDQIWHGPSYHVRLPTWRGTYDRAVLFNDHATYPIARVHRQDGRVLQFKLSGGTWLPDGDVVERLTRLTNGSGETTGWTLITKDDELETYNAAGQLQSIQNRAGIMHTLAYDSSGRVASVTHSFGQQLTFTYDSSNRVSTVTLPGGGVIQYAYAPSYGNLASVTYPDTRVRTYHYESGSVPRGLTGITDESSTRFATYGYDGSGRATSSTNAGGANQYGLVYTSATRSTVTDPRGTSRTIDHTVVQKSARATAISATCSGCGSGTKAKTFDTNGNVATRTNFNNIQTTYSYDLARDLETSRTEAFGTPRARTITTQWHPTFRLPAQIDEPGKRTTFTYDSSGNQLTRTVLDTSTSESRTWTYTYNGFGQVLTADGPRTDVTDVTTYTYYSCTTGYQCGQLNTVTNALGHVTTYNTYNVHGLPLTITDPNGMVTTLAYDARQRLTSRTVGSEQTTFEYWPTGLLKKATLPDSSFLLHTYDAAHRLTQIDDSEGNRIVYTLDTMGNRTAEQLYDPSAALTQTRTRVFNTLNQLWKELGAAGTAAVTTTFGYDSNGNQTGINAPLSRNTVQGYDELNRMTQVTDPLSGVTQYGYNALDQLISVTDPRSKVTSYTYNALGDLTQQVSPDTGTTANTYDSGGNLATSTDARSKTGTYAYDALNRVTSVTYPDQTIGYTYDSGTNQKGRLTQVSDASGSTSWSYDTHGRVLSRQQSMGVTKTVGYAYDSAGRLQTLTLPSGNAITYGYTDGRITSLTLNGSTTILSNVLYQPFGPTRGWTWGNSTLTIREYDTDGKVTDIDSAGLKTYSYDDAFRITAITDAASSSLSQSYGYDLLDRLTSATGTSLNQGWTYDANGNRLTQTGSAASTYTISTASNRLSSVSGALSRTYSYDNNGNTTNDGTVTFTYSDANRMVSATKTSVTTNYALNALGQRVKKAAAGSLTYFVYDEDGHLIGEYDDLGGLIEETVWFGEVPVATLTPNPGGVNLSYIHTDHLNTPRRISRPSDNVVMWRWDSDAFGTTVVNEDPDGDSNPFAYGLRLPGQYFDSETGLHYNYLRDGYDPAVGRYTQSDPIGLSGGINTYAYALDNPVAYSDSEGLEVRFVCRPLAQPGFRSFKHCYVVVTCPEEGWSNIYSLFPEEGLFPFVGRRHLGVPGASGLRDDYPAGNTTDDIRIEPRMWPDEPKSCERCQFEKAVRDRFFSFPRLDVPYRYWGPNSNSFADGLLDLPGWGVHAPRVDSAPAQDEGWNTWGLPLTPTWQAR